MGLAYQNLGRLSDATHWLLDTLCEWQRRRRELTGAQLPDAARHRDHLSPTRCMSAESRFGRSDSNADDIDAYLGAPGRSLGPQRASRRQMVLAVGGRPRATARTPTPTGGSTGRGSRRSELRLIMERGSRGEIRVDLDATVLASFLINAWEGAVLRAKAEKTSTPSKNSKKSCSRNCLPRLPTLGGMNHEPLQ